MAAANNFAYCARSQYYSLCLQSVAKRAVSARRSNMFHGAPSYIHIIRRRWIHHVAPKWLLCVFVSLYFFVALARAVVSAMQFKCEIGITWADSPQMYSASVHICVCIFSDAITEPWMSEWCALRRVSGCEGCAPPFLPLAHTGEAHPVCIVCAHIQCDRRHAAFYFPETQIGCN